MRAKRKLRGLANPISASDPCLKLSDSGLAVPAAPPPVSPRAIEPAGAGLPRKICAN